MVSASSAQSIWPSCRSAWPLSTWPIKNSRVETDRELRLLERLEIVTGLICDLRRQRMHQRIERIERSRAQSSRAPRPIAALREQVPEHEVRNGELRIEADGRAQALFGHRPVPLEQPLHVGECELPLGVLRIGTAPLAAPSRGRAG